MTKTQDSRNYKAFFIGVTLLILALLGGIYFSLKKWVSKTTNAATITANTVTNTGDEALKARITALEKVTPDEQHYLDLTARVEAMEQCFEPVV